VKHFMFRDRHMYMVKHRHFDHPKE
jgi:hypothetical protein